MRLQYQSSRVVWRLLHTACNVMWQILHAAASHSLSALADIIATLVKTREKRHALQAREAYQVTRRRMTNDDQSL